MKKITLLLATLIIILNACNNKKPEKIKIRFAETTDLHGSIFPYDFINKKETDNSLAQVSYFVKTQRNNKNYDFVLLDNGDILQGQPTVYYYNFEDTSDTHICAKVMNYMKYDAATIGNHDIEAGHPVYDRLIKEFNFPWLSANGVRTDNGKPYFIPYQIIDKQGIKIAILGLTTPGIPNWLPPDIYKGIDFQDMVKTADKWVKYIKENENPDLIVGLFHSGHDYTYGGGTKDEPRNENAVLIVAEEVPGFDIIFCGHDHDNFKQTIVNKNNDTVYIVDAGSHAKYIGIADVELTYNKKTGKYDKKISTEVIETDTIPIDEEFIEKFSDDFEKVKKYVSDTVGYLKYPIDGKKVYFGDNKFMDFIHDMQLRISGAQISFAAPLSFSSYLDSGYVTVSDMFKLYRFENLLYTMKLKGSEIKDYLEYSYSHWYNTINSPNQHILIFKPGSDRLKYKFYNFDSAEGINYSVDITKPEGKRITITSLSDGQKFDADKWYTVAINSYRGNGGGGHLTVGAHIPKDSLQSRIVKTTEKDLRYYIMQIFRQEHTITPHVSNNWKIIPQQLAEKATKKDYEYLFE